LLQSGEILGAMLCSIHNLHFYMNLVQGAQKAISENRFESFRLSCLAHWRNEEVMLSHKA